MTNSSLSNSNSNLVGIGCSSGATTPTGVAPTAIAEALTTGVLVNKQMQKNQATSPNPPLQIQIQQQSNQIELQPTTEPNSLDSDQSVTSSGGGVGNVVLLQNTNSNAANSVVNNISHSNSPNSVVIAQHHHMSTLDVKKEEFKPMQQQQSITLMSYAPAGYQSLDNSGMFQSAAGTTFPTTYQQGV